MRRRCCRTWMRRKRSKDLCLHTCVLNATLVLFFFDSCCGIVNVKRHAKLSNRASSMSSLPLFTKPLATMLQRHFPFAYNTVLYASVISRSWSTSVPKSLSSKNFRPSISSGKYVCLTLPSL